jgi:serine/threonine-protein kinase HipA
MWPIIGDGGSQLRYQSAKLAMAVRARNAHYKLVDLRARHWRQLAQLTGVPDAFNLLVATVQNVGPALEHVQSELPANFPEPLWRRIREGMISHQTQFLHELESEPLS